MTLALALKETLPALNETVTENPQVNTSRLTEAIQTAIFNGTSVSNMK